jgi:hypothetical protein
LYITRLENVLQVLALVAPRLTPLPTNRARTCKMIFRRNIFVVKRFRGAEFGPYLKKFQLSHYKKDKTFLTHRIPNNLNGFVKMLFDK